MIRDDVEITLPKRGLVDTVGPLRLYVRLVDIDFDEMCSSGVEVDVPIGERAYGMRDVHLTDPSGNHLSFGQAIAIGE